jgi:hypothetical protein
MGKSSNSCAAFRDRIDPGRSQHPALHRIHDHEIERGEPGGAEAFDLKRAALLQHPAIMLPDVFGGQGSRDVGQVGGLSGNHGDVEQVALVAASGPSQLDQGHSHRQVDIVRELR